MIEDFVCCKCGAAITNDDVLPNDSSKATCSYCGVTQAVKKATKDTDALARAAEKRMNSDFVGARIAYETIIDNNPKCGEAYWGSCLCRFGIELVNDKKTGRKVPTCHRTETKSIFEDSDYQKALKYTDAVSQREIEALAEEIDRDQKRILEIVKNDEPYDVFICFKDTEEGSGERTEDSETAEEIYNELYKAGYKVFYSRVTLKRLAGEEYEPHIYAALDSAKVMLLIGTSNEHINAVWVKNEWSRFLDMMGRNNEKHLIPCIEKMEIDDLPVTLQKYQVIDTKKRTVMQEILANVERIVGKNKQTNAVYTGAEGGQASQIQGKLNRIFEDYLSHSEWKNAQKACNEVLDLDYKNAMGYVGLLMAELQVKKFEDLADAGKDYSNEKNFVKAMDFADDKLKEQLKEYLNSSKYAIADRSFNDGSYSAAKNMFQSLGNYRDSKERFKRSAEAYNAQTTSDKYNNACRAYKNGRYEEALNVFKELGSYEDSEKMTEKCVEGIHTDHYNKAQELFKTGIYTDAKDEFTALGDFQDSPQMIGKCDENIKKVNELADQARMIYRAYNNDLRAQDGTNAPEKLAKFSAFEDYMRKKYKWFGMEAPEPKKHPRLVFNLITIGLMLILTSIAFMLIIRYLTENITEVCTLVISAIIFVATLTIWIASRKLSKKEPHYMSIPWLLWMIFVSAAITGAVSTLLYYRVTEQNYLSRTVWYIIIGAGLMALGILIKIKYHNKLKKNEQYLTDMGTIKDLSNLVKDGAEDDAMEYANSYSQNMGLPWSICFEVLKKVAYYYDSSDSDKWRVFSKDDKYVPLKR